MEGVTDFPNILKPSGEFLLIQCSYLGDVMKITINLTTGEIKNMIASYLTGLEILPSLAADQIGSVSCAETGGEVLSLTVEIDRDAA